MPSILNISPSPRYRLHSALPGLSLVELLVTIGVVSILGTILLAVMSTIWNRKDSVQCVVNLRAIHSGYMLWAADHGGTIPLYQYEDEGGTQRNQTYIGVEGFSDYLPSGALIPETPAGVKNGYAYPHICPSDEKRNTGNFGYFGYSYGANGRMIANGQNVVARWTTPSQTMFYIDATSTFMPANAAWPSRFAGRHNGRANAIFLDGHVESLAQEDIPSPSPTTGPGSSSFWNAEK